MPGPPGPPGPPSGGGPSASCACEVRASAQSAAIRVIAVLIFICVFLSFNRGVKIVSGEAGGFRGDADIRERGGEFGQAKRLVQQAAEADVPGGSEGEKIA